MSRAHLKQNTEFSHLYQKDISTIGYKGPNYPPHNTYYPIFFLEYSPPSLPTHQSKN